MPPSDGRAISSGTTVGGRARTESWKGHGSSVWWNNRRSEVYVGPKNGGAWSARLNDGLLR